MVPLRAMEIMTRKTSIASTAITAATAVSPVVMTKTDMTRVPVVRKKTKTNARKSS